ncbi:MAG: VanW family protein [Myxococcota bacterium]
MAATRTRPRRVARALLWAALGSCVLTALCAAVGVFLVLPADGKPAPGLFVGSRIPPADPSLGSWLEARRRAHTDSRVLLLDGFEAHELTLGDLGVEIDVAATMDAALRPGRAGTLARRARLLLLARYGFVDVPVVYALDLRRAEVGLRSIADHVRRAPKDAYLDLRAHQRVSDVPGVELDVQATMLSVMRGVLEGRDAFPIRAQQVPAQVTLDDLDAVDVTKVAASFDTKFSRRGVGAKRAHNIELAARAIDGMVLKPGQSFSFNTVVGRRTLERGYTWAPVIVGDELRPGVGGGICQVASTLYAAALHAAMQITERWAHGRPSSYIRMGMDATVSYPSKDLRFVNNLPYPVILHVFFPEERVIRAEILGGEAVAKVRYRYGISRTAPFVRRIVPKPWLQSGKAFRKQKGIKGYSVVSMVELDYGTRVDKRTYYSEYRPTPEIFWVSPNYDEAELPDLPAGAKGVEGRLTEAESDDDPAG